LTKSKNFSFIGKHCKSNRKFTHRSLEQTKNNKYLLLLQVFDSNNHYNMNLALNSYLSPRIAPFPGVIKSATITQVLLSKVSFWSNFSVFINNLPIRRLSLSRICLLNSKEYQFKLQANLYHKQLNDQDSASKFLPTILS
jgi:hypothetical protein